MSLIVTASQTVGPYLRIGFLPLLVDDLAPAGTPGERITVRGNMFDGEGRAINDGVLEIWQADAQGRYAHPEDGGSSAGGKAFRGFGRILADRNGAFQFTTIKPGPVAGPGGQAAGAAPGRDAIHARHADAPFHAHVFPGRASQRDGLRAAARAVRPARHARRRGRGRQIGLRVEHRVPGIE